MPLRHPTPEELERWDSLVATDPAGSSFWQFTAYADWKQPAWKPVYAVHELSDGTTIHATYLERRIPVLGTIWYASCGPRVATEAQLREVCQQLQGLKGPFAVVMEPPVVVHAAGEGEAIADRIDGLHVGLALQPIGMHSVEIDLTPGEDELLAGFKQRTRRYIRKNASATVEIVTDDSRFDTFWRLYEAMLQRSSAVVRPREYFEKYWRFYLERGQGYFVLATPEGESEPTAGAFCLLHEDLALYKDGGSVREKDSNGLQYRVQWEAMRYAKEHGAVRYDMFGAPPSWQADDPEHHLHGLVQFKTGFAPIVDYAGAYLLATRPRIAAFWEKIGFKGYAWLLQKLRGEFFI